jgi:hypothetical protein
MFGISVADHFMRFWLWVKIFDAAPAAPAPASPLLYTGTEPTFLKPANVNV